MPIFEVSEHEDYPVHSLRETCGSVGRERVASGEGYFTTTKIELSDEEAADFGRVKEEYDAWQTKIADRCKALPWPARSQE